MDNTEKPHNSTAKKLATIVAVVGVLIAMVILFVIFSHEDSNDSEKTDSTQTQQPSDEDMLPEESKTTSARDSLEKHDGKVTQQDKDAVKSAKKYLDNPGGFSPDTLTEKLKKDHIPETSIDYALDNSDANWNEQAKTSAQEIKNSLGWTNEEITNTLVLSGFTDEQAQYAVDNIS